jgi:uridine kinase
MDNIINKIKSLKENKDHLLIAIDGRCTSGKTTLSKKLSENLDCNVIHMDHFFLRPEQRTEKRKNEPGGNVDYERFYSDVIIPLKNHRSFSYTPYNCQTQKMSDPIEINLKDINIIEGTYSCHPIFADNYDLKIYLDIDESKQVERIIKRDGKTMYKSFRDLWIPMEELYFSTFKIKDNCNIYLNSV